MKLFLKLKAWQMFVLVITPMLLPMLILQGPEGLKWFGAVTLIWMLVIIGWLYAVGSTANRWLPEDLRKSPIVYRLGFGVTILYTVLMAVSIFPNMELSNEPQTPPAWLLPIHVVSTFGMFYGLWFTAKQFVTLQRNEKVKFLDYSGPFFLFWFSPIGVWFLQPKINEVFSEERHNKRLQVDAATPRD